VNQVENLELDRSQDRPSEPDRSEATLEPTEVALTDPETIQESIEETPIAEAVWALD